MAPISLPRFGRACPAVVWLAVVMLGAACRAPHRPTAMQVALERAEDHERARRHDHARASYQDAIQVAKNAREESFARYQYAQTLISWGELDVAVTELERVVALTPEAAPAWHDLGILRSHRGDRPGAAAALAEAKRRAPADPRPRIALAALRLSGGERDLAVAEYRALLELELPDPLRSKIESVLRDLVATP